MTRFHTSRIIPVAVLVLAAAATTTYTITDLGSLGYGISDGLAINANGQVTGYSYLSTQIQVTCPPRQYGQQKKCYIHPYQRVPVQPRHHDRPGHHGRQQQPGTV